MTPAGLSASPGCDLPTAQRHSGTSAAQSQLAAQPVSCAAIRTKGNVIYTFCQTCRDATPLELPCLIFHRTSASLDLGKPEGAFFAAVNHAALKVAATRREHAAQALVHLLDHASLAASTAFDRGKHRTPRCLRCAHADGQQYGNIVRCQLGPMMRISAVKGHDSQLPDVR